eukprot:521325_1
MVLRIKLTFSRDFGDLLGFCNNFVFVIPSKAKFISDVIYAVGEQFRLKNTSLVLSLGDFILLPSETVGVLRDDDIVSVGLQPNLFAASDERRKIAEFCEDSDFVMPSSPIESVHKKSKIRISNRPKKFRKVKQKRNNTCSVPIQMPKAAGNSSNRIENTVGSSESSSDSQSDSSSSSDSESDSSSDSDSGSEKVKDTAKLSRKSSGSIQKTISSPNIPVAQPAVHENKSDSESDSSSSSDSESDSSSDSDSGSEKVKDTAKLSRKSSGSIQKTISSPTIPVTQPDVHENKSDSESDSSDSESDSDSSSSDSDSGPDSGSVKISENEEIKPKFPGKSPGSATETGVSPEMNSETSISPPTSFAGKAVQSGPPGKHIYFGDGPKRKRADSTELNIRQNAMFRIPRRKEQTYAKRAPMHSGQKRARRIEETTPEESATADMDPGFFAPRYRPMTDDYEPDLPETIETEALDVGQCEKLHRDPQVGDLIAFRRMQLNPDTWAPELTPYQPFRVTSVDSASVSVRATSVSGGALGGGQAVETCPLDEMVDARLIRAAITGGLSNVEVADSTKSLTDSINLQAGGTKSPAGSTKSPADKSPADSTKSPEDSSKYPADKTKLSADKIKSSADNTKSSAGSTKSTTGNLKSPAGSTKSQADNLKSQVDSTKSTSPADYTKSQADNSKLSVISTKSSNDSSILLQNSSTTRQSPIIAVQTEQSLKPQPQSSQSSQLDMIAEITRAKRTLRRKQQRARKRLLNVSGTLSRIRNKYPRKNPEDSGAKSSSENCDINAEFHGKSASNGTKCVQSGGENGTKCGQSGGENGTKCVQSGDENSDEIAGKLSGKASNGMMHPDRRQMMS